METPQQPATHNDDQTNERTNERTNEQARRKENKPYTWMDGRMEGQVRNINDGRIVGKQQLSNEHAQETTTTTKNQKEADLEIRHSLG
jgi:hypothetical protein